MSARKLEVSANIFSMNLNVLTNIKKAISDIGIEIIINEAVELAKRYGEEKSSEFINGVLAKIAKK